MRRKAIIRLNKVIERSPLYIKYRSNVENVYHCCVQKTASQWLHAILCDKWIYRYSGLKFFDYAKTFYSENNATETPQHDTLPTKAIISPIYIDFQNFQKIEKPNTYKSFFIMRDPRDIVVSWYFSVRFSHKPVGRILEHRKEFENMSIKEGLIYSIKYLHKFGLFSALSSWVEAPELDPSVMLVRFEDLVREDNAYFFGKIFYHCDIPVPEKILRQLLNNYSFDKLSGGRQKGVENTRDHYRKGVTGDWRNYFDSDITNEFSRKTGDLIYFLEYK